jgi:molecular chaperone GrpE
MANNDPAPREGPDTPASAEDKTLDKLLAEAQARIDEQKDAWMRAVAEADNVRKRAQADVAAAHKYGVERFAESLLPVVDSLEAAMQAKDVSAIEITFKQLKASLEKANIREISPAVGTRFDPHVHQAMAAVESNAEPNTVVAVMLKGYALHDRVLRPALVTVAKAVEKSEGNPISDSNLQSN